MYSIYCLTGHMGLSEQQDETQYFKGGIRDQCMLGINFCCLMSNSAQFWVTAIQVSTFVFAILRKEMKGKYSFGKQLGQLGSTQNNPSKF